MPLGGEGQRDERVSLAPDKQCRRANTPRVVGDVGTGRVQPAPDKRRGGSSKSIRRDPAQECRVRPAECGEEWPGVPA
jgi:hypothetical protein